MNIYIPTGTTGLSLSDFSFRLYRETAKLPDPAWTLTETATAGTYAISGLPDGESTARYTLTWSRSGVGSAFSWGGAGSPLGIIIPEREAGLALSDFSVSLFRNGLPDASALTLSEVGSPGDYSLAGWPIAASGASWAVTWTRGDVHTAFQWTESAPAGTLTDLFGYGDIANEASDLIEEAGQPLRLIHQGGYKDPNTRTVSQTAAYYNATGIQLRDADLPPQYLNEAIRTQSYYLAARGVPSDVQANGWQVERSGKASNLTLVEPVSPGGIPVLYLVQAAI